MKNEELRDAAEGSGRKDRVTAASDTRIDDSDTRGDGGRLVRTTELTSFA
jgi:hypothetical protein